MSKVRTTVLIVDDEEAFHETVTAYLGRYRYYSAYNGIQALEALEKHHIDVALLDLNLPDTTGLELIHRIRAERDDLEIIVITSHIELKNAVEAVKAGAFDFLAKSYENFQHIGEHIERALANRRRRKAKLLAAADETLREGIGSLEASENSEIREITRIVRQVAPTPLSVLIEGESGVGKELLARYLHHKSDRAQHPFVPVNLAAVPASLIEATLFGHEKGAFTHADRQRQGKFELAEGGTLFLDEVGELDPSVQVKLLRVLQEREIERLGGSVPIPVDVRLVAATNKRLEAEVMAGRFREDLWFRLNVVRLKLPPLRQRRPDIPQTVRLLADRAGRILRRHPPTFTDKAIQILQAYSWPGNVRELENAVMRLIALKPGNVIDADDIPVEYCMEHLGEMAVELMKRRRPGDQSLYTLATRQFERYLVRYVVDRAGTMAEAARYLGVSYATVKVKMAAEDAADGEEADPVEDKPSRG